MLFGNEWKCSLVGGASALSTLVVVCGACGSDPAASLGTGFEPSGGSSSAGGATTGGKAPTGGTSTLGGAFGVGGTAGLPDFGSAGSYSSGGAGSSSTAGAGGTTGVGGGSETGGSGTGGSGGSTLGCAKSTGADPLIDDFEDSDTTLKLVDGRNGPWETFDDGSEGATYMNRAPSAAVGRGGTAGFCTSISGYKAWGANLVATMASPKCGYDASTYDGVCFWAKGEVTAGGPFVFAVGTADTVPENSGGTCTQQGRCNSHYEANPVLQAADYKQYCYKWSALKSPNIANPPAFAAATIVQIEWKFPAANAKSTDGNFCVDDVSFCKGDACAPP